MADKDATKTIANIASKPLTIRTVYFFRHSYSDFNHKIPLTSMVETMWTPTHTSITVSVKLIV